MNKIILFGFFGSGNIGNDTSLEAVLYNVKKYQPEANLICVCNGPGEVSRRFGIQAIPMSEHEADARTSSDLLSRITRFWLRLKAEIFFWLRTPRWFTLGDEFIVVGSGAADDLGVVRPWHRPYVLYKWCKAARMGGAQVIFMSVGAGPILNPISRILMLKALRMADYRSYRDLAAFNYLQSVGFDASGDRSYPDLVYSFPRESLPLSPKSSMPPKVVGLGLINYYGWRYYPGTGEKIYQEYISKMKQFVSWLLYKGFTIRVLSGDVADQSPAKELIEFVKKEGKVLWREKLIFQEINDVHDLFHQIAQTDIVVASRFHNVLCALMLERSVISLSYHEKNDHLMNGIGLGHHCLHIEHFTHEQLLEQFNSSIQDSERIVRQIHDRLDAYRSLLDDQYKTLLSPFTESKK